MNLLEDLFAFPIILVDGENEERKLNQKGLLGLPTEEDQELDIIIGEAECPFYDFIGVTDRWIPTKESLEKAMDGKFNACYVVFANMGAFVVPWNKKRFKAELKKFQDAIPQPVIQKLELSKEQTEKFLGILKDGKEDGEADSE